jgi:hypothetical protein
LNPRREFAVKKTEVETSPGFLQGEETANALSIPQFRVPLNLRRARPVKIKKGPPRGANPLSFKI